MAFTGQVALVTGGGSGMGQRACERLASQGAKVAAIDVNEEGLERTAAGSPGVETFAVDVTDHERVAEVVRDIEQRLGPIDRVMAAAAIMPTALVLDMPTETFHRVMRIDYEGVVNTVKATLPGMVERRRGDMVVFGSLMALLPTMHLAAYCAAKAAVAMFTEIAYHENRDSGVRFACVCPPMVTTPLIEQATSQPKTLGEAKPMSPDEVLDAIEAALEKGAFWVTPGQAKGAVVARRLIPNLIWKNMHKIEGI